VLPRATSAGCGGVVERAPEDWHRDYRPPLAIGDSTMLLALNGLAREGFAANAHGCRQYPEALSLLSSLAHAHLLPRLVVIALGANGEIHDGDVERALQILGGERLLVLLTPRELGGSAGTDAKLVRLEGRRHPDRVRVLDWVAYSAGHPGWFEGDGLHLTPTGSAALAHLIGQVAPLAAPPRSLPRPRCTSPPAASPPADPSALAIETPSRATDLDRASSSVRATVLNAGPVAAVVVLAIREAVPRAPTIATACASVPAGGRVGVSLRLTHPALVDLSLRGRYRIRLELTLIGTQGSRGATITAPSVLERVPIRP